MNAVLEREEAVLFFRLWIPLLDYVNQRREIFPDLGKIERPTDIDIESAFEISEILWQEPELIDEFLRDTELSDEDREIISEWKKFVSGRFVIERHLKKGAIFISVETGRVFLVKGINLCSSGLFSIIYRCINIFIYHINLCINSKKTKPTA